MNEALWLYVFTRLDAIGHLFVFFCLALAFASVFVAMFSDESAWLLSNV